MNENVVEKKPHASRALKLWLRVLLGHGVDCPQRFAFMNRLTYAREKLNHRGVACCLVVFLYVLCE